MDGSSTVVLTEKSTLKSLDMVLETRAKGT